MMTQVHPKLPMRDKEITKSFYIGKLGFRQVGGDFDGYLMLLKDHVELHFFEFKDLDPMENYGMIYLRSSHLDKLYQAISEAEIKIHPKGLPELKPWGIREFSILDPDRNLITFGEENRR